MNRNLLKAEIVKQGYTIGDVAKQIGVNEAALYSRFSKSSTKPFTLELASKLSEFLRLSPEEAYAIFLCKESV